MNTLTRMVAVAAIGCAVGGAVSSLAVAQGLITVAYNCTLSYKDGPLSSPLTVKASSTAQAQQMAVAAATPTGASCTVKEGDRNF